MAYGLVPVKVPGSSSCATPNTRAHYRIASGYGTALLQNDPVSFVTGGTIERAAAGGVLLGSFAGCTYKLPTGEFVYSKTWPASTVATEIHAMVYDDPKTMFKIESDQDTTALEADDRGNNADIIVAAGSTLTGTSGVSLDSSTQTAASAQLRILDSAEDDFAFTAAGTPMDVYCYIAEHFYTLEAGV